MIKRVPKSFFLLRPLCDDLKTVLRSSASNFGLQIEKHMRHHWEQKLICDA